MGMFDHPRFKLGLKPHGRTDQLLALGWAAGQIPAYEPKVDRLSQITIGLDGNDQYGDCGPTSVDNHRRLTTKALTGVEQDATLDQVFDLYRRSGNPQFDPATDADDNGVDMATMLAAVKSGGLAGEKVAAFARLKDTSDASVYAAIDLFGAVLFAVDLQTAQQDQSNGSDPTWDYSPSGDWGGHAIVAGAYDSSTGVVTVGSWGMAVKTTAAFRAHQLQEVWVPIWPELLGDNRFVAAVDYAALQADFHSLTGGTLPAPTPNPIPAPTPTPSPTPAPDPEPTPPAPGDDNPFRDALANYPGLPERVQALADRHRVTPEVYVAWCLAGELHFRHADQQPS